MSPFNITNQDSCPLDITKSPIKLEIYPKKKGKKEKKNTNNPTQQPPWEWKILRTSGKTKTSQRTCWWSSFLALCVPSPFIHFWTSCFNPFLWDFFSLFSFIRLSASICSSNCKHSCNKIRQKLIKLTYSVFLDRWSTYMYVNILPSIHGPLLVQASQWLSLWLQSQLSRGRSGGCASLGSLGRDQLMMLGCCS